MHPEELNHHQDLKQHPQYLNHPTILKGSLRTDNQNFVVVVVIPFGFIGKKKNKKQGCKFFHRLQTLYIFKVKDRFPYAA